MDTQSGTPRLLVAYGVGLATLALGVGAARSLSLFAVGTLPGRYLLHGVALNAGLVLLCGAVVLPGALLLFALRRRAGAGDPLGVATAACAGAYLAFAALSTSIAYRDPLAGGLDALAWEAARWGAGGLGALALAAWVRRAGGFGATLARCAALAAAGALAAGGARVHAGLDDPAASAAPVLEASAAHRPDVWIVLVDTLRADHVSSYGHPYPTTPNVDALATEGVLYTRAFAQAPWTRPSVAALLTSRYPPEIGVRSLWNPLPPEVPILPQLLRAEGYATAGIVSSVHVSAQYGFDKGWDELDIGISYLRWTGVVRALTRLRWIEARGGYPRYHAGELTDRAIAWLERQRARDPERPVFLYLHYADPHGPYRAPGDPGRWRDFAPPAARALAAPPDGAPSDGRALPPAERAAMIAAYDAEIAFFDEHVGRLFDHLRARGELEDALVVVTSDHGEEFFEHGGWAHAHTLYNELLHVPLIVKYPARLGLRGGRRDARLAGLVDVVPTLREVLDARWPQARFRGRSLLEAPPGPGSPPRSLYADNHSPFLRALYRGSAKLTQSLGEDGAVTRERYGSLDSDFAERADGAAAPDGATLDAMRRTLRALSDETRAGREIEVDPDTREELRALGYLE